MELKSPIHSQDASNLSPIAAKLSQKFCLSFLFGGPYTQERIQGAWGGSEKHQAEILFLFVTKHSRSIPGLQERTRPPLEPTAATCAMSRNPSLFKVAETWEGEDLVYEMKRISGD
jgi:hypothetical protein